VLRAHPDRAEQDDERQQRQRRNGCRQPDRVRDRIEVLRVEGALLVA
jgi:hypothetical protein